MSNKLLLKLKAKNEKYIVIFCVKEANSYNFIKTVAIKPTQTKIKFDKENTYPIDIERHTYRKGKIRYYCIDIHSQQIYLQQLEEKQYVSSRLIKMIMDDEMIQQLAKATTTPIKQKYDLTALAIGLVIGGLIGLIIGFPLGIFTPIM